MPEQLFALTETDVKSLRNLIRQVVGEEFRIPQEMFERNRMVTHIKEGILDATLTAGSTSGSAMSVYTKPSGTWTDSGENITVKWPAGTIGPQIDSGTWVVALWINGDWRPIAADC